MSCRAVWPTCPCPCPCPCPCACCAGVAIFLSQGHLRARPLPQTLPPTRHSPAASQGGEYAQDRREDGGGDRLADDADDSLEDEGCVPKKARLLSSSESRRHSALLLNDDGDGTDGDGARKGVQEDGCVVKACRDMLAAAQVCAQVFHAFSPCVPHVG